MKTKFITSKELEKSIKQLNNKVSRDMYGISNRILKLVGQKTQDWILKLFNTCLKNKEVPVDWKFSQIVMIQKKSNDPKNIKNYWPISITVVLLAFSNVFY